MTYTRVPLAAGRLLVLAALGLCLVVIPATPAAASCAGPPVESPHAFTGTVVSVDDDGRRATVRLDAGTEVTVLGGPGEGSMTSVDRLFARGARYEFHPLNATSPFEDNACTATRQLSGPAPSAPEPHFDSLPAWLPIDEQAGPVGYAAAAALGVVVIAALAVAAVAVRRLASRRPAAG